jgi:agmatine/peptidylarginine deiminase
MFLSFGVMSGCRTASTENNVQNFQNGLLPSGMVDERLPVGAVAVAVTDSFRPHLQFVDQLLANLPPEVGAYLIVPNGNPYMEKYAPQFQTGRFREFPIPIASNWVRDYFPEVVIRRDGSAKLVQFRYAHPNGANARELGMEIARLLGLPFETSELIVEGGNLLADVQQGRLFLTEVVLRNNPTLTVEQVETELRRLLEIDNIVWMPVLPMEGTGHIDIFAKFVGENNVIVSDSLNPLRKPTLDLVAQQFLALGYSVMRIPNAEEAGQNAVTKSYTNSLLVNNVAFVPSYYWPDYHEDPLTDPSIGQQVRAFDETAAAVYRSLGYYVVQIPMLTLTDYGGAIHCLTKQIWAGIPRL